MILGKMLDIKKGEIITVVGSGGKTSFINYFTKYYKDKFKVLLTTTTKIYEPTDECYKDIYLTDNKNLIDICSSSSLVHVSNNIVVCGKRINEENKIIGLDFKELDLITPRFDITFIEGDGSKRKKLKGWNKLEPVVYTNTTQTIGIIDITSLGMDINEENIHRLNEFKKITCKSEGTINIFDIRNIVLNSNGLFKYAKGKKILFINKVENIYYENLAKKLIAIIKNENVDISIFYGSIKENIFKY